MILLIALLAALAPRLTLFLMWIFDYNRFDAAYDGFLIPFLGALFLPFTTVMYVFVYSPITGLSFLDVIFLVIAFMLDISVHMAAARRRAVPAGAM